MPAVNLAPHVTNVKYPKGRYIHYKSFGFYPTLCHRVPRWHQSKDTDEEATCPACLKFDLQRNELTNRQSTTSQEGD